MSKTFSEKKRLLDDDMQMPREKGEEDIESHSQDADRHRKIKHEKSDK